MKAVKYLVLLGAVLWNSIFTKLRFYQILVLAQIFIFMVSLLLLLFLRLTKPLRRPRLLHPSPVSTLKAYGRSGANHTLKISYAPKTEAIDAIMKEIKAKFATYFPQTNVSFEGFPTEVHLVNTYCTNTSRTNMAIVFREASDPNSRNSDKNVSMCTDDLSSNDTHWVFDGIKNRSLPDRLEIVIRPSPGSETPNRWHVDSMFPHDKLYCTRNALPDYTSEGMIILLQLVTEALIKNKTSKSPNYKLSTLGFGCQQKWIDHIQKSLRFAMPIIISVAYIPSAVIVACEMTKENTRNMKKTLSLIGINELAYTVSWILYLVIDILILASMITLMFCMPGNLSAVPNSNPLIIFVFIASYGLALISLTVWLTDLLFKDRSDILTLILIFITQTAVVAYYTVYRVKMNNKEKIMLNFLIYYSLDLGCSLIAKHEETGQEVNWSSFQRPPTILDKRSIMDCIFVLIFNMCGNIAIKLALEYYGTVYQAFSDMIKWLQERLKPVKIPKKGNDNAENIGKSLNEKNLETSRFFEDDLSSETFLCFDQEVKCPCCHNYYSKGLSFKVYSNKTTALLGLSETELSKVIDILSGQTQRIPSTVIVRDIPLKDYQKMHPAFISMCLQKSSVFEALSVQENIQLFAQLKGVSWENSKLEAQKLITACKLDLKFHIPAGNLSSPWSTLLRLAIASTGDPQIIMVEIDSMSSLRQMQVRMVLDVIKQLLASRSSILASTTAEKAFEVAEKAAVILSGHTICYGSKEFVQHCFGCGYRLHISLSMKCNVEGLIDYMQLFVSSLVVLKKSKYVLITLLPLSSRHLFEFLLGNLHMRDKELNITSLEISEITMDDLLSKLREFETAQAHMYQVEKYRSAMEVASLKALSAASLWPRILYSAISRTPSGHFSVRTPQNLQGTSEFSSNLATLEESGLETETSVMSVFHNLQLIDRKRKYLAFQSTSTNIDNGKPG